MSSLNIQKLTLHDYRCFESIEIDFHEQLTVLVASNGAGKTSILDAIAVAFGPYIGAFDEGVGKGFYPQDIRRTRVRETITNEMEYAPNGVRLEAKGRIHDQAEITWKRSLSGPKKAKTTTKEAKNLSNYGKQMQTAVRSRQGADATTLPLLAYYGTARLWQQKKLTEHKKQDQTRTIGYTDCLSPGSSYKSFVEWFRYWTLNAFTQRYAANEAGRTYELTEFDQFITSVSVAVNTCLAPTRWENIEYSYSLEELVAHHQQHGKLAVALLSDGIRNMIGMVADIAFRATKLNPHLGTRAATDTAGVVLIDEIDMHLHPEWQQTVLPNLMAAFPMLQFIVTTHSPQVLSTIRREHIRVIGPDIHDKVIASPPLAMTYGAPSGTVLHTVMNVDPQPPIPETGDLQQLTAWVDQGHYQDTQVTQLMQKLEAKFGERHPQLQRLQRSIQRQKMLKS